MLALSLVVSCVQATICLDISFMEVALFCGASDGRSVTTQACSLTATAIAHGGMH